ncbi:MAG: prolipoprotein diacylglyceryl transferase [Phycisphaerales bacterium]|nr:prolipoprotein diacylglyceryl transferase [Phycisphaerales bacterium]MCI0630581.1 prolipoprotein diacylglyceryl transferase [Phycisphaerales bacterium]MCI0676043.1 prolipoprotein diacylglyceryl transferase [Phycisphaerales bacterium]
MNAFLADSYLHTLDPFAIEFPRSWPIPGIRWYGLAYAFGFLLAWWMVRWVSRRSWSLIPPQSTGDLMFAVIVGALLGGRLGYAIFYEPHLFTGFTSSPPWWRLLEIHKGGMSSHGGMIGVILSCCWFGRRRKISSLHILDIGTLACTPGLFFGRVANFINAELWGKALPPDRQSYVVGQGLTGIDPPWWSIKYPQEIIEKWTVHSDPRLFEIEPLRAVVNSGENFYQDVVEAAQTGNATVVQTLRPLLTAYYPSQILQAITDGPILLGLLILIWLKPRKPGVVGGWFLIIYGVLRMATEVFRQPDEGVNPTFGLSRGQALSAIMIISGIIGLAIVIRRDVPRLGGLFSGDAKPTDQPASSTAA